MFYLASVVTIVLLLVVIVSFPFFLKWLAQEDIFFTTVKEGAVKAIMRGDSFDRLIMSFEGFHLNDPKKPWYKPVIEENDSGMRECPDWEILYHGKGNGCGFVENNAKGKNEQQDSYYDDRSWLLKHLGLYWVGWPWANSVYVYQFEWNETYTNKLGEEKVLPRAEATDFVYAADFTYAIVTESAETNDRLPTDELTLVTVAIRNPYRALFSGEDWMRRITAAINRHVRNFVGNESYMDLISLGKKKEGAVPGTTNDRTDFSGPIIKLNTELPDDAATQNSRHGLKGRYGVEIRTADLQTVELSGDAKKQDQEATTKEYFAKQEAAAILLKGQAEADVIKMRGEREATALKARLEVIKEHGEAGILLAGYDAVQESSKGPGNTIIWANNPLASLAGILKPETKGGEKS